MSCVLQRMRNEGLYRTPVFLIISALSCLSRQWLGQTNRENFWTQEERRGRGPSRSVPNKPCGLTPKCAVEWTPGFMANYTVTGTVTGLGPVVYNGRLNTDQLRKLSFHLIAGFSNSMVYCFKNRPICMKTRYFFQHLG